MKSANKSRKVQLVQRSLCFHRRRDKINKTMGTASLDRSRWCLKFFKNPAAHGSKSGVQPGPGRRFTVFRTRMTGYSVTPIVQTKKLRLENTRPKVTELLVEEPGPKPDPMSLSFTQAHSSVASPYALPYCSASFVQTPPGLAPQPRFPPPPTGVLPPCSPHTLVFDGKLGPPPLGSPP